MSSGRNKDNKDQSEGDPQTLTISQILLKPELATNLINKNEDNDDYDVLPKEICVECESKPSTLFCFECNDTYCNECFMIFHKKGNRKLHRTSYVNVDLNAQHLNASAMVKETDRKEENDDNQQSKDENQNLNFSNVPAFQEAKSISINTGVGIILNSEITEEEQARNIRAKGITLEHSSEAPWSEKARYIPVRLNRDEQKMKRLIDSELTVSEYTTRVDDPSFAIHLTSQGKENNDYKGSSYSNQSQGNVKVSTTSGPRSAIPAKRMFRIVQELCSIFTGLAVATNYDVGGQLLVDRNFKQYSKFYQKQFEIARRYKITNPEKMRTSYGKLIYALMDTQIPEIKEMIGFDCVKPINTVYDYFKEHGIEAILDEPQMDVATREIFAGPDKARYLVDKEIKSKEKAVEYLSVKYSQDGREQQRLVQERRKRSSYSYGYGYYNASSFWNSKRDDDYDEDDDKHSSQGYGNVQTSAKQEDVKWMIYSLADNQCFLRYNSLPCQKMLEYLIYYFKAEIQNEGKDQNEIAQLFQGKNQKGLEKQQLNNNNSNKNSQMDIDDNNDENDNEDDQQNSKGIKDKRYIGISSPNSLKPNYQSNSSLNNLSSPSPLTQSHFISQQPQIQAALSNTREARSTLSITYGVGGARLAHTHTRQFSYVKQTLILWREILHDFFKLWYLAESDLLDEDKASQKTQQQQMQSSQSSISSISSNASPSAAMYRLRDTGGQGTNRIQKCPRTEREMQQILRRVQQSLLPESWVGSSVIHLGDSNVPNALMFIDKYTQVSRILQPVVSVLDKIPTIVKETPRLKVYIDTEFGGVDLLRMEILQDFFRFGFDGSGSDNFFEAGSCIDGRLTSAWNWCNKLEKKRFFPVFLLCGFMGFDGQFQ
ncbi:MAG: hypothetical protein EZS28_001125 [Streblomastix strix]|uniref:B box-type domain-containing protein n=1 Tax=Streblomastix strix TaxID=222440 RepID=A0A5J4X9Y8_9EUKA|nr:MAG: hypothetical protein EZS28_001118 [Streblomastix strix]KAA6403355.1 MAG: hypothetical protein EZS28_001125 [Streblomastix strix]